MTENCSTQCYRSQFSTNLRTPLDDALIAAIAYQIAYRETVCGCPRRTQVLSSGADAVQGRLGEFPRVWLGSKVECQHLESRHLVKLLA